MNILSGHDKHSEIMMRSPPLFRLPFAIDARALSGAALLLVLVWSWGLTVRCMERESHPAHHYSAQTWLRPSAVTALPVTAISDDDGWLPELSWLPHPESSLDEPSASRHQTTLALRAVLASNSPPRYLLFMKLFIPFLPWSVLPM